MKCKALQEESDELSDEDLCNCLHLLRKRFTHVAPVSVNAPVSVSAPVSVNIDNNGRCRSRYCKHLYNNSTVRVSVDSNLLLSMFTLAGERDENMCNINAFC